MYNLGVGPTNENFFSIKVHHGRDFTEGPVKRYVGSTVEYLDNCDPDKMSLLEMDDIAEKLGHVPHVGFYYRLPGVTLDNGLVFMNTDEDVMAMIACLPSSRTAEMYLKHFGGIKLLEYQNRTDDGVYVEPDEIDIGVEKNFDIGLDFGLGLGDDQQTNEESNEVGCHNDEPTEYEHFSDGSYGMGDEDDHLFETNVDEGVE